MGYFVPSPKQMEKRIEELVVEKKEGNTVDSRYLEVQGTSRYLYLKISDLQNWGKIISNNHVSQMNM